MKISNEKATKKQQKATKKWHKNVTILQQKCDKNAATMWQQLQSL